MDHSINTTPLLHGSESENEDEDEITVVSATGDESIMQDEDKPLFKPSDPRDKYNMAYFIFYLLGMVTLLPWNFFITADDYWLYKFRDVHRNVSYVFTSHDKRTPLQAGFTSYLSVASAVPNIIFLILNTCLSQRISLNKRVNGSLFFILILFVLTTVFVRIDTDDWQQLFFIITILTVVLLNASSAILCGSIFGVIGKFSPKYITATLGGQALGGIFAALAEIIALSIGASSVHSAFVYFMVGNVTILLSIIFYILLSKSIFFKFHLHQKAGGGVNEFQNELVKPQIICYKTIVKKIWIYGVAMFMTFAVTLAVYPGITVLIESEGKGTGNKWNDVFFVPTIAYMLFSIGDYVGRIFAGRIQRPKKRNTLLILSLARLLIAPMLMLCNAQPRHYLPVIFEKDYEYIVILFIFALSNGYLANITAICAPRVVEQHEKETASSMMTVFMGVGLAFGSSLSLIMVKLL